jgi:DNA mismatch endonuclease (patch repair protein)
MKLVKYARDSRSPAPKSVKTSYLMSGVRSSGTAPELVVRKLLSSNEIRGYRLNNPKVSGRPDICLTRAKIAIFIHGCFWHSCPTCALALPRHNRKFWSEKFEANKIRDKRNRILLKKEGWEVITLWECKIKKGNARWQRELLDTIKKKYGKKESN